MKIHLIRRETIEDYMIGQARCRTSFEDWLEKIRGADWFKPDDIYETFNTADLLGNGSDRVVFDIAGNNFRMIAKYWFGLSKVHLYIKWIGTHAEYGELCKRKLQYAVDDF
ncbi:MAG TPA: type II toxin-antitoxin system HigB family toxin [Puia sp.]|nr:type II toxin-antitoxin system HigB family toxin [Puia sp.]